MKAKDIMEQVKTVVSPDTTLKEAVNLMRVCERGGTRVGVKGVLVLNGEKELVGVLSIKDILKAIVPAYMPSTDLGEFTWDGMLEEMCRKVARKRVEEIMTKEVKTVTEDAPLMECADFIIKHNIQRIPVVGGDGKVVGIIYLRDIYYAIVSTLFDDGEVCGCDT